MISPRYLILLTLGFSVTKIFSLPGESSPKPSWSTLTPSTSPIIRPSPIIVQSPPVAKPTSSIKRWSSYTKQWSAPVVRPSPIVIISTSPVIRPSSIVIISSSSTAASSSLVTESSSPIPPASPEVTGLSSSIIPFASSVAPLVSSVALSNSSLIPSVISLNSSVMSLNSSVISLNSSVTSLNSSVISLNSTATPSNSSVSSPDTVQPGVCPPVWGKIATELVQLFLDTASAQCNDDARAAIRAMFHDCGTWSIEQGDSGGCDGSLILAGEAYSRNENRGLETISTKLLAIAKNRGVGVADLLVFAASIAVVTCPLGPQVTTYVGRKDSWKPSPDGKLPDMHASGDALYELFQNKTITARELAALIGAHATSKSFHQTPAGRGDIGLPQDSTPGIWDVKYYSETTNPPKGVFVFDSDIALAKHPVVGPEFANFVNRQGLWNAFFALAMTKMSLFGVPGGSDDLTDCTEYIPIGTVPSKRDLQSGPGHGRYRRWGFGYH